MPGYDGTGPRGRGPMTGRCRGYCVLKIPRIPGEPLAGFAGLSGKAVTLSPPASGAAAFLGGSMREIGAPRPKSDLGNSPEYPEGGIS